MYVVLIYNRWENDTVDCVIGPFATLKDAQNWRGGALPRINPISHEYTAYRRTSIQRLETNLPEWADD